MYDPTGFLNTLFNGYTDGPSPEGVDAYGKNVAGAAAQGALGLGTGGLNMINAYQNEYMPYDRKMMSMVDNMGTDAYRAQQRGQAMTGVQQQSDAQMGANNRRMAAMGVNPNSGAFAAMNGMMAQQTALNKVMAAMGADRNSRDEYMKGLGAINAAGLKVGELGARSMGIAGELGKVGLAGADLGATARDRQTQAGAAATSAGAAAMNASTNASKAAQDYQLGLGGLALKRYDIDETNKRYNAELDWRKNSGSFGNTFGNMLLGAGGNWLSNGGFNTIGTGLKNWLNNSGGYDYNPGDAFMPGAGMDSVGSVIPGLEQYEVPSWTFGEGEY